MWELTTHEIDSANFWNRKPKNYFRIESQKTTFKKENQKATFEIENQKEIMK